MKGGTAHPQWQERTVQLLGESNVRRLAKAHVLVVGLGGVGGMAAEMLCRSGIGKLTLVDADVVQPGNLNRQLAALHSTLGRSKTDVMGQRLLDINPGLDLELRQEFLRDEGMEELLDRGFDYVVDAIDTLSPKIFLIHHSLKRGLRLTSSMGSGGKMDPSQIRVADFGDTYNCKLAFILRKKLRKLGVHGDFPVVFSTEQVPKHMVVPVEGEPNKKSTVGTNAFIPAVFGCTLASVVVRDLVDFPA
ncbi:MAG: tRNA threonylcarbamoyladenosine dehydratase [Bacteroidales bacterium]